ncbi:MAG: triphosphoribosyl-dephospho-CoA synthase [Hyphomicrobiales bacterium]|nr:triphosphoribosyl-dephospho-CoA synthase [Hyphomicrobiales bacterium]MDE2115313.1 triphosphoribosyl-dephospho-CoA synthase [Hyphomicrobiales bacterium]
MHPHKIEAAFEAACWQDIAALKPGNVHIYADGHDMVAADFLVSAQLAAPQICRPDASLGARIETGVQATQGRGRKNTNLGILLLCAPLAMAAQSISGQYLSAQDLRGALAKVLANLTQEDARAVSRAMALESADGIGDGAAHEMRDGADMRLMEAMTLAAPRDAVARQYVTHFADVFDLGLIAIGYQPSRKWGAVSAYFEFLATYPDGHIERKFGAGPAQYVQAKAIKLRDRLNRARTMSATLPELLALDRDFKTQGLNPGTSDDLTVASLFVAELLHVA